MPRLSTDSGATRAGRDSLLTPIQAALADRYRIEERIGRGGMAVVYRATDLATGGPVAIKVMRPELGYEDGVVERFRIEARVMGHLRHENIVEVRAHGEAGNILWFEMQLIDGSSLDRVISDGPLDWRRAARLIAQAAGALAYAHRSGVIHRDVKPANLLVCSGSDHLRIVDFGIAKIVGASQLTATGITVGTPAYMSPEQFTYGRDLTTATDQYSLGVVAWQMITGLVPPALKGDSQRQRRRKKRGRVRSLAPECPPALATLIERMLAYDPGDRWPDLAFVSGAALEIATSGDAAAITAPTYRNRMYSALKKLLG